MINRCAVFTAAWESYRLARVAIFAAGDESGKRRFLPSLFGKMLRMAWAEARKAAAYTVPVLPPAAPVTPVRAAAIREELRMMDYSDAPTNWHRHTELRLELGSGR